MVNALGSLCGRWLKMIRQLVHDMPRTVICWNCHGWKRFKRLEKEFVRMLRQAFKAKQRNAIKYKFGIGIPRNFREAVELDKENSNTLWQDALTKEMDQIKTYKTFTDLEKGTKIPKGDQKIMCNLFGIANLIWEGTHIWWPREI